MWPRFVRSVHHLRRRRRRGLLLRLFVDDRLGGEHQSGNRGRVLQRRPRHLERVYHAGLEEVFEGFGLGVEAEVRVVTLLHLLGHDRAFFSFSSVSVGAPTLITATPPTSFASRSCSFSRSYSEVVSSICARNCRTRASMSDFLPAPSTMVVESLSTTTFLARPRSSSLMLARLIPRSSVMALPPVSIAMSSSIALRRSPKPGALTAQTCSVPRSLLTTSVASASPSTSSAMTSSGLPCLATCSRSGNRSLSELIFLSWIRIRPSSITHSMRSGSITK